MYDIPFPFYIYHQDLVKADKCLTEKEVKDALDKIRGSVMIVYPMGLPPHDPIKLELDNEEDLSGTQVYNPMISFLCFIECIVDSVVR